jgi:gliding motility-associated-like protein
MRKLIPALFFIMLFLSILFFADTNCFAQAGCTPQTPVGVNLINNGNFEQGYTDLSTDYNNHFTQSTANGGSCVKGSDCNPPDPSKSCGCTRDYSVPNEYLIGKDVTQLHISFHPITDHTSGVIGGGQSLFVDGSCSDKKPNGTDFIVWSRTVNIVPNTNYFFSAWVASLGISDFLAPDLIAVLVFKVNGDSIGTLPASSKVGEWVTYERNWFSKNISGPVTISIVNTKVVACDQGDDFAIDDITFTAGCAFASTGPKPNLGPSFSICDKKLPLTLSSGIKPPYTNINIKWSTGETTPTIKISAGGTYSVCVDSAGSCTRSDIINITNNFVADIGPDVRLCNPLYSVLKVNIVDSTNFNSIQWFKDGVALDRADNFTSISANAPGTYRVNVNGPGNCSSSDSAVVSTGVSTIPVNDTYCVASGQKTANLSVTGPTTIKWYANETGGAVLAKGPIFTTPALTSPGPFTYWAEDTTSFTGNVGESGIGFTNAGYPVQNQAKESKLKFDAIAAFRLDSLTVGYYSYGCTGTTSMTISILDANGAVVGSKTVAVPCKGVDPSTARVALGINIPKGSNYTITSSTIAWNSDGPVNWYPKAYKVNSNTIMTITENGFDASYAQWSSPSYWNWKISYVAPCGRVPVFANEVCSCKPTINAQPHDTSLCGGPVAFTVAAKGAPLTFAWQVKAPSGAITTLSNTGVYNGTNTNRLTISNVSGLDKNLYMCVISGCGTTTSRSALLTLVVSNNSIQSQPVDTNLCASATISFKVVAKGSSLNYQWQEKVPGGSFVSLTNTGKFSGVTSNLLSINNADSTMSGNTYQCIISSTCAPALTSNSAKITLNPSKINIIRQPISNTLCPGAAAIFELTASGNGIKYKWQEKTPGSNGFSDINEGGIYSGADSSTLKIANIPSSMSGNQYRALLTGSCGATATSKTDTLTLMTTPLLSLGKDTVYCPIPGSMYILTANSGFVNYVWQDNVTGPTFSVLNPGTYSVTATAPNGCKANSSVTVRECDNLFIPNIITPFNHDGKNDYFFIEGNRPNSKLDIFNRWGTLIYRKDPYLNNWAGEDQVGNIVSEGVYFYIYTQTGKKPLVGNIELMK